MQTYERRNHKLGKIICILVMAFSVLMIGLSGYLYYKDIKSKPLITYPQYVITPNDWTSGVVTIEVTNDSSKISAYSFDGGVNFQESNRYDVLANGGFSIVVKDINGRLSKTIPITITKIDKEPPQINFENPTVVEIGSNFDLRNGVVVTDGDGSGLNSTYAITPTTIDATTPGEYTFTYTAFDKVGNYTEKVRTVIIKEKEKGTTYYRYRKSTVENYQCEPYLCNCVVSSNGTCPTGYTANDEGKCCQTCYKTCRRTVWGEWSQWSTNKTTPSTSVEVETKIEVKEK